MPRSETEYLRDILSYASKTSRMRNRLVHNYFEINYEVVWAAATTEMQPLIDVLKNLVSDA